jgi:uncharacterized protein
VLAVSAALAAGAGVAATQLPTDAGTGTLVDSDTAAWRATQHLRQVFGEEPVVVLAEGELENLLLTPNLARLLRLEGCLSGRVPKGAKPPPGPCAEIARMRPVKFLAGPATFLNEAVIGVDEQLRRLIAATPRDRLRGLLVAIAARYGIASLPSLGNGEFIAHVVFDLSRARGTPKARLAYLFPNSRSAQIALRLRPDLSDAERHRALRLIREAVDESKLHDGRYVVSGVPVVVDGVARALKDALLVLLAVAVAVMALVLFLVFRSRWPLLPLAVALASVALAFGLLSLLGGSLTMASIAALPILIGLAVDYAIQFQARYDEAGSAERAAASGGPTIGAACLATGAGFLALQLSPIPMVRDFGLLLVGGVAIGFAMALVAGFAALGFRRGAGVPGAPSGAGSFASEPLGRPRAWLVRKTGRRVAPGAPTLPPRLDRVLTVARTYPRRVLAVGLVLAVGGWALGTQIETQTDIRKLAPQNVQAVEGLNELQDATGVSGELEVSVESSNLENPALIEWMAAFKRRVLKAGGFAGADPSCRSAEVCPGPALSDFVTNGRERLTSRDVRAALAGLSGYDLEGVAPREPGSDRLGRTALLSFGIRAQRLERQQELIERVRSEIGAPGAPGGPPRGTEVQLAGLPVLAAQSAGDLSSSRYWLTLAGLLAVGLALFAVYRSPRRALVPLVPTVLATGWASLLLWISGIPLNPMSAALGALTIAIATEFGVLLAGRFHEERGRGLKTEEALRRAYALTGAAVVASGATAIAGFAVLIVSDIAMLRDFGLVTVVDLAAALIGVLLVLPATLAWVERER